MLNPYLNKIKLSKDEYKEYARHLILDKIGINGQKRLKQAKILFIGAGGLAASAILYLITSGIGEVGIVDNDKVSQSNLHRQILYTQENINQVKVNVLKKNFTISNQIVTYKYILLNLIKKTLKISLKSMIS